MNISYLYSLIAVIVLALFAYVGSMFGGGEALFGLIIPSLAGLTFVAGFTYRIVDWARSPVPFRIPTTCGQQKSLPWIESAKIENPTTTAGGGGVFNAGRLDPGKGFLLAAGCGNSKGYRRTRPVHDTVDKPHGKSETGQKREDNTKKSFTSSEYRAHVGKQSKYNNRYEGIQVTDIHSTITSLLGPHGNIFKSAQNLFLQPEYAAEFAQI
jgi:hypothetical protein